MSEKGTTGLLAIILLLVFLIAGIAGYFFFYKDKQQTPSTLITNKSQMFIIGKNPTGGYEPLNVITAENYLKNKEDQSASFKIIDNFTTIDGRIERSYANGQYSFFAFNDNCYLDVTTLVFTEANKGYELYLQCLQKSNITILSNDQITPGLHRINITLVQTSGHILFPTICLTRTANIISARLLTDSKTIAVMGYDVCYDELGEWATTEGVNRTYQIEYDTTPFADVHDNIKVSFLDKDRDPTDIETNNIRTFKYKDQSNKDLGIKNIDVFINR